MSLETEVHKRILCEYVAIFVQDESDELSVTAVIMALIPPCYDSHGAFYKDCIANEQREVLTAANIAALTDIFVVGIDVPDWLPDLLLSRIGSRESSQVFRSHREVPGAPV